METRIAKNWSEFKNIIADIRSAYKQHACTAPSGENYTQNIQILFRGQASSQWPLKTTLERTLTQQISVNRYCTILTHCVHEIESFSGHHWNLKNYPELTGELNKSQDRFRCYLPTSIYPYLVYLRHHGCPSPLLDWSESPYIAAFFAFSDKITEDIKERAVYCFIERPEGSKAHSSNQPMIFLHGPYATTDKRHFSQKAWYTIATRWNEKINKHFFIPHEDIFKVDNTSKKQDVLIKIVLPNDIRKEVLHELNDYNINYFTLFHTEDALVKAIGMREFELNEIESVT